jgi:hypothetical protein
MALTLALSKGAVASDISYYYITDSTGVYSVTNPTGYPNRVATFGVITGGSGYTNGTYNNVFLTVFSGTVPTTLPKVNITVAGGTVTVVTLVDGGAGVDSTTVFNTPNTSIGGTGSGFQVPVGTMASYRDQLSLFLYGFQYDPNLSPNQALAISNTIPNTVTQWQVMLTVDGYQYFTVLGIPNWLSTSAYTSDAVNPPIVFYGGKYYKNLVTTTAGQDPLSNPTKWLDITSTLGVDTTLPNNTTIYSSTFNIVTNWFGKQSYQRQLQLEAQNNCGCSGNSSNRAEVLPYQKMYVMLSVSALLCAQQKYPQADEELKSLAAYSATLPVIPC